MVELICRNEPRHFFCLYNVLKLFEKGATIDVKSVYKALKNAEVEYFAVLTGCLKREDLEKLGVKNVINSVAELPDFLRKTST